MGAVDVPKIMPYRVCDTAEEDAGRVDDTQAPDGRDIGRNNVSRVYSRLQQADRDVGSQTGNERRSLVGLLQANLFGRTSSVAE